MPTGPRLASRRRFLPAFENPLEGGELGVDEDGLAVEFGVVERAGLEEGDEELGAAAVGDDLRRHRPGGLRVTEVVVEPPGGGVWLGSSIRHGESGYSASPD